MVVIIPPLFMTSFFLTLWTLHVFLPPITHYFQTFFFFTFSLQTINYLLDLVQVATTSFDEQPPWQKWLLCKQRVMLPVRFTQNTHNSHLRLISSTKNQLVCFLQHGSVWLYDAEVGTAVSFVGGRTHPFTHLPFLPSIHSRIQLHQPINT